MTEYVSKDMKVDRVSIKRLYPLLILGSAYSASNDVFATLLVTSVLLFLDGISGVVHVPFLSETHDKHDVEDDENEE